MSDESDAGDGPEQSAAAGRAWAVSAPAGSVPAVASNLRGPPSGAVGRSPVEPVGLRRPHPAD